MFSGGPIDTADARVPLKRLGVAVVGIRPWLVPALPDLEPDRNDKIAGEIVGRGCIAMTGHKSLKQKADGIEHSITVVLYLNADWVFWIAADCGSDTRRNDDQRLLAIGLRASDPRIQRQPGYSE